MASQDFKCRKMMVILGTRPEAIKLAPVILEAKSRDWNVCIVLTGQHPSMAAEMLQDFNLEPDHKLVIIGDLNSKIGSTLIELNRILLAEPVDYVIVQGDTFSAMAGALAASNLGIKVAHVEAGLRTYDKYSPFPEENYRRVISAVADYHFASTIGAANNLWKEGFSAVHVTGNTVIDALRVVSTSPVEFERKTVILTLHRRESWGGPFLETIRGIIDWLSHTEMQVIWPVHPSSVDHSHLTHARLIKTSPMRYGDFIGYLSSCQFVVTDSGGIQEEAAYLGKPVVVVRNTTERPEGVAEGIAVLVNPGELIKALKAAEASEVSSTHIYGDGYAATKIMTELEHV